MAMTIEEIVKQLEEWSDAYYAGHEMVDDPTFDLLEDELRIRDPQNAWFTHNREKAGYGVKVIHPYEFIGSLTKIHSVRESKIIYDKSNSLGLGYPRKRIHLSAKLDGTSLVTYFKDGKLDKAVTRGNGIEGVDVTHHYLGITAKYSVTVPQGFTGAIRGEVVFRKTNWNTFKAKHPEAKAPRNSGTGLINQKVVQADENLLDYVIYDVVATTQPFDNYWELLEMFNIPVVPYTTIDSPNLTDDVMKQCYDQWSEEFPCDGVVLRELDLGPVEGIYPKGHNPSSIYTYPKHQEAYKFQAEIKLCEVQDIVWQLGRTGKLTPVLKINPVEMSGAVVENITAHNAENVRRMRLGKGAKVLAYRSGEVIPTLHQTVEPADQVIVPTHCPFCGSKLESTLTGKDLICTFEECEGKAKYRIYNFLTTMCDDIKGLGDAFLFAFVDSIAEDFGYERDEVLTLDQFLVPLASHKGTEFKYLGNADNRIAAAVIERLTQPEQPAEKLLLALGIKLLGTEAAKKLANSPAKTKEFLQLILNGNASSSELAAAIAKAVPGQMALATNIYKDAELIRSIVSFYGLDNIKFNEQKNVQYYAVTGGLSKPRKQIEAEFSAKGWEMASTISRATVLITDDPNSGSSKNQQADKLGIAKMTEADFRKNILGE